MRRAHRRWLGFLGAAIVATTCAAVWLILAGNGHDGPSGSYGSDDRSLSNREQWEQLRRQGVREERERRFRPDASTVATIGIAKDMPPKLLRIARRNLRSEGALDLRWDDARYVKTPIDVGLWVVRGPGMACMFHGVTAALSCRTAVPAEKHGLALGVYTLDDSQQPTNFTALGIVPAWVRAVRASVGGKTVTVPVVDGAYGYRADASIKIHRFLP